MSECYTPRIPFALLWLLDHDLRPRVPLFGNSAALRPRTFSSGPSMQLVGQNVYLLPIFPRLLVRREASTTCHSSMSRFPCGASDMSFPLHNLRTYHCRCFVTVNAMSVEPMLVRLVWANLLRGAAYKDTLLYAPYDALFQRIQTSFTTYFSKSVPCLHQRGSQTTKHPA